MAERWRRLCRQYNMREKDFCLKLSVILASLVPINLQAPSLWLQLRPKECSWWEAQLLPSSWSSVFSTRPVLKNDAVNTFPGQKSAVPISLSLWGLLEGKEELSRPKDSLAKDFSQDFCANENYEVCITMTEINWEKKNAATHWRKPTLVNGRDNCKTQGRGLAAFCVISCHLNWKVPIHQPGDWWLRVALLLASWVNLIMLLKPWSLSFLISSLKWDCYWASSHGDTVSYKRAVCALQFNSGPDIRVQNGVPFLSHWGLLSGLQGALVYFILVCWLYHNTLETPT